MNERVNEERLLGNAMTHLSTRLRDDLSDLLIADKRLSSRKVRKGSPDRVKLTAYSERGRVRMLRLAQNMETCGALLLNPDFAREEPCDLVGLMSEMCESAVDLAEMMGIRLTFACAKDKFICAGHTRYLRLCMGNLLSNAMKSTPRGGHVRMVYQYLQTERASLLTVEDSGKGIAPEELPTVLEDAWTRPRTLRTPSGAGLGLAICRRVAEGHRGALTVESEPGKGSKFTVRIPDAPIIGELRQDGFYEGDAGYHPIMVMLSDALPWEAFTRENLL